MKTAIVASVTVKVLAQRVYPNHHQSTAVVTSVHSTPLTAILTPLSTGSDNSFGLDWQAGHVRATMEHPYDSADVPPFTSCCVHTPMTSPFQPSLPSPPNCHLTCHACYLTNEKKSVLFFRGI